MVVACTLYLRRSLPRDAASFCASSNCVEERSGGHCKSLNGAGSSPPPSPSLPFLGPHSDAPAKQGTNTCPVASRIRSHTHGAHIRRFRPQQCTDPLPHHVFTRCSACSTLTRKGITPLSHTHWWFLPRSLHRHRHTHRHPPTPHLSPCAHSCPLSHSPYTPHTHTSNSPP